MMSGRHHSAGDPTQGRDRTTGGGTERSQCRRKRNSPGSKSPGCPASITRHLTSRPRRAPRVGRLRVGGRDQSPLTNERVMRVVSRGTLVVRSGCLVDRRALAPHHLDGHARTIRTHALDHLLSVVSPSMTSLRRVGNDGRRRAGGWGSGRPDADRRGTVQGMGLWDPTTATVRRPAGVVRIEGHDRLTYLHSLLSQHLEDARPGTVADFLYLDAKGTTLAEGRAVVRAGDVLLVTALDVAVSLADALSRFTFLLD